MTGDFNIDFKLCSLPKLVGGWLSNFNAIIGTIAGMEWEKKYKLYPLGRFINECH